MAKPDREFPSLATERLRRRAPNMDDAEAFRALLSIPEVTRYSNWPDAPKPALWCTGDALNVKTPRRQQRLCLDHRGWHIEGIHRSNPVQPLRAEMEGR